MKDLYITLATLSALLAGVRCCEPPAILLSVQFARRGDLRTQQSSEILLLLFADCTYQGTGSLVEAGSKWFLMLPTNWLLT